MADYYTQTVIHQHIPERLIAPFELLLLAEIFESDRHDDSFYYYASERPNDFITIDPRVLCATLAISPRKIPPPLLAQTATCRMPCRTFRISISTSQPRPIETAPTSSSSRTSCAGRKGELPYLTIAAAYTCSKMRADGFGGMAIIITPRGILYQSTYDVLQSASKRAAPRKTRVNPRRPDPAPSANTGRPAAYTPSRPRLPRAFSCLENFHVLDQRSRRHAQETLERRTKRLRHRAPNSAR